jgi:putative endonuclease
VHCAYFVRCADGTLYAGYARDAHEREKAHNDGRGAKYTRSRRPVTLIYVERFRTKGKALRREYQLKQLTREKKEALVRDAAKEHRKQGARYPDAGRTRRSRS